MADKAKDGAAAPQYHRNLITNVCRASYAHVWEKSEMPNGEFKFNIALLVPKSDEAGVKMIKRAIKSAAIDFFGEDKTKWPKALVNPLHDGDESDRGGSYEGHFYLNAKTDRQPGIVGPDARPIMDQDQFYSGCFCRASLNFYGYDKAGNKGVGVGLNNLMKTADGDRLDGKKNAESEFAAFAEEGSAEEKAAGDDFLDD